MFIPCSYLEPMLNIYDKERMISVKRIIALSLALALLAGCGAPAPKTPETETTAPTGTVRFAEETRIRLSDNGIAVEGDESAVYTANDIIYYEEGHDFTYGEGEPGEAHGTEEAAKHIVVHIVKPGTYVLSGRLSAGQIAVDLGEGAEDDPEAVVNLVLNGLDITCGIAPAVIFYNVYECGSADAPSALVDTSAAGANVYLAEGTVNTVTGSHVAKIYKPETVELSEDGTEVEEAKKLHKYDGAFYSRMSLNMDGAGELNIIADNEGLDSEMHLTVNGGKINIFSGNDGINTNEDGVSVTTVNGGELTVTVTGETGEGDGIDSNGWLVINGGIVTAAACATSGDGGIDSDMGIHLNGGTVLASGSMLDRIGESTENYAVFTFAGRQTGGTEFSLKNADGQTVLTHAPANDFSILIVSGLAEGEYTLWQGEIRLAGSAGQGSGGGMPGGMMPSEGFVPGERPEGETVPMPEGNEPPGFDGGRPPEFEGKQPPEFEEQIPPMPDGQAPIAPEAPREPRPGGFGGEADAELSDVFTVTPGGCYFCNIQPVQ